jgi:hypothetical protein
MARLWDPRSSVLLYFPDRMLHALLHGKLDSARLEPQRREDALTSSVFGTLVMTESSALLAQWLGVGPIGGSPGDNQYWFWPRLAGPVEPDVILRIADVLVIVEAKYGSSRNDLAFEEADDERPVDQIVRQHRAVSAPYDWRSSYAEPLEGAVRDCQIVQAFVVDARRMRSARREHAESQARLPQGAQLNLVTWQGLYKLLLEYPWSRLRWADDLRTYLRLCGLASFQGIHRHMTQWESLRVIPQWKPVSRRAAIPQLRDAGAALAAEPAIANLQRWRIFSARTPRSRRKQ